MQIKIQSFRLELDKVNVSLFPSVLWASRAFLPIERAIYFLVSKEGEVVYVGKTENLYQRWVMHDFSLRIPDMDGVRIAWLPLPAHVNLDQWERWFIIKMRPKFNDIYHGKELPEISILKKYLKKCRRCGREFNNSSRKTRYCSASCRSAFSYHKRKAEKEI